ncbi:hypothetical protein GCM10010300_29380 [Streptomyces olivaceoviridis]|nr:hypothetical protein GCM10010300_29380 [Streptomyces olivaceoviridis]
MQRSPAPVSTGPASSPSTAPVRSTSPIVLEPWQRAIVDTHPWEFVRGLIHSDGWKTLNQSRAAVTVSIARKASVALMDAHVGPKH